MDSSKAKTKPINRPSVRHASHNHPLRVFKSQDEDEVICSGCECDLTGQAFKCTKSDCDYFLHKSCFDLTGLIHHKSHIDHPLTLLHSPPFGLSTYTCDACGEYGSAFTYYCSECRYNVHVGCLFVPENVEREDHEHPLTLIYNTPCKGREDSAMFKCDVCEEDMSENLWVYYCKECDYGTHVHSCATYEDNEPKRREEKVEKVEEISSSSSASTIKSVMEAEKKMKEMAMIHQLQLDAIDTAGSYVDSSYTKTLYYW